MDANGPKRARDDGFDLDLMIAHGSSTPVIDAHASSQNASYFFVLQDGPRTTAPIPSGLRLVSTPLEDRLHVS